MTQDVVVTEHNVVNPVSTDANGDVVTDSSGNPAINQINHLGPAVIIVDAETIVASGTAFISAGIHKTFQAIANGTSGAFSVTVNIEISNDGTNWIFIGAITLSGTATTAETDGFPSDTGSVYIRANVVAISGTGANVTVIMGG